MNWRVPDDPDLSFRKISQAIQAEISHCRLDGYRHGENALIWREAKVMALPVLLALDENTETLGLLETQLRQRYAHDYRVECLGDATLALQRLTDLADACEEVALVLAGRSPSVTAPGGLLAKVRELHPHAKCALLVPSDVWADKASGDALRALIALGRVHYYVVRPAGPPDEVFHETVSSFLLEWATERRTVPHTIHIVGEAWSGRAFELRETFERCAVPYTFCLADSDEGRQLLVKAGPDATLPMMVLPDGRILSNPSNMEIAEAAGATSDFDQDTYDVVIVGAGPAGLSAARTCTQVVGGDGEGRLERVVLRDRISGEEETVAADALFVLIGADPHTDWLPAEIARDPQGFLLTGEEVSDNPDWHLTRRPHSLETSMPGVFAAGDVRRSSVKRVASAVGEGSIAIGLIQTLLAEERLDVGVSG
jgi:hypothetical protein